MAFQSEFSDNAKLKACLNKDTDHIGEQFAPKGPWVLLIKKALNTWAAKQKPPVKEIPVNDLFDRETGDLVALYKTKQTPPILNFEGKIDRIVGKKTVDFLDKELPKKVSGDDPKPKPPGTVIGVRVVNQPAGEVFPLTILPDNDGQGGRLEKPDLNSSTRQLGSSLLLAKVRVWSAKLGLGAAIVDELEKAVLLSATPGTINIKDFLLKMLKAGLLEKALFDEITFLDILKFPQVDLSKSMSARAVGVNEALLRNEMSVGGKTALEMFTFWVTHAATPFMKNFPSLDADTARSQAFIHAAEGFEARVKQNLQEQFKQGLVDYHDLVTGPGPERVLTVAIPNLELGKASARMLPSLDPELALPDLSLIQDTVVKICIGSFQGVRVFLSNFKANVTGIAAPFSGQFSGQLLYELRDHFGVDDEDCEVRLRGFHGTPGQVAMWVLQHYSASGHKPFVDQVLVRRDFSGTF